jgi:3-hydroxyisobutyrate dehydrogenase-like beta-hydroxyacid dehydrogenase
VFEQSFAMPALKSYAERLYARDADGSAGFSMTAGLKDLRLIREAATSANCHVEIADAIAAKMEAAIAEGMADKDWSSVQEITRKRAGLDARLGAA